MGTKTRQSDTSSGAGVVAKKNLSLKHALKECRDRFLNKEELCDGNVMLQVELAHWHFLDVLCCDNTNEKTLPRLSFRAFTQKLLQKSTLEAKALTDRFSRERKKLPVAGAALISPKRTECIMVRGLSRDCPLGFPKGKLEPGESPIEAAVREVYEETGIVLTLSDGNPVFKRKVNGKEFTLYLAQLPKRYKNFTPAAKHEIGECRWVALDQIQAGASLDVSQPQASAFGEWIRAALTTHGQRNAKRRGMNVGERKPVHWCTHPACLESKRCFRSDAALRQHVLACHPCNAAERTEAGACMRTRVAACA